MFGSCTPYWKEATLTDVFPAMLSLPVSLPLNHGSLPLGFAKMFVKVKSIPARRIFILKNVYINGHAVVLKFYNFYTHAYRIKKAGRCLLK
jgi:hypothetical protein